MIYQLLLILLLSQSINAMEMKLMVMQLPEEETECVETTPLCGSGHEHAVYELEGQLAQQSSNFDDYMAKSESIIVQFPTAKMRKKSYFKSRVQNEIDKRRKLEETFFVRDGRKWHLLQETLIDVEKRIGINPNNPLFKFVQEDDSIQPHSYNSFISFIKQNPILRQNLIKAVEREKIFFDYYCKIEEKKDARYNCCVNCGGQLLSYGGAAGSFCGCIYSSSPCAPPTVLCCAATNLFTITTALCFISGIYCSFRCCCPEQLSSEKCCVPRCLQVETKPQPTHMQLAKNVIQGLLTLLKT